MNTKYLTIIVLGILILMTGCTSAEALGVENEWRLSYSGEGKLWLTNAVIVFESGDKCSLTIYENASTETFAYKILVKDDTYDNYMVAVNTLHEGYTIEDLKSYTKTMPGPSFADLVRFDVVDPGSTTFMGSAAGIDEGELYFTCMVQGSGEWKIIDVLGPLKVR